MRYFNLFLFVFVLQWSAGAQTILNNASFEGEAQDATTPTGWHVCEVGATPDILPGFWGVKTEASEGETYIGLITRDDGSFESIGQRLQVNLKADECYQISVDLAYAKTYAGYNNPLQLRIWGGSGKCSKTQLIVESAIIDHIDWKTYTFKFVTKKKIRYIIIEAYHDEGKEPVKGNILIDNISEIKPCKKA